MVESNSKKLLPLFILVTTVTVILDQVAKMFIASVKPNLQLGMLNISYLTNTGAGFGILQDKVILLTAISFIVALITIITYKEVPKKIWPQVFMALFLGGVIGNLIDRLFRGMVIDFLNFSFWPAFNLADSTITIGIIGMLITICNEKKN